MSATILSTGLRSKLRTKRQGAVGYLVSRDWDRFRERTTHDGSILAKK